MTEADPENAQDDQADGSEEISYKTYAHTCIEYEIPSDWIEVPGREYIEYDDPSEVENDFRYESEGALV